MNKVAFGGGCQSKLYYFIFSFANDLSSTFMDLVFVPLHIMILRIKHKAFVDPDYYWLE